MPRNPKPLQILVSDGLLMINGIKSLASKGHSLIACSALQEYLNSGGSINDFDIIFMEKAWRMTEDLAEMSALVDTAVRGARAIKYRRKRGDSDDDD